MHRDRPGGVAPAKRRAAVEANLDIVRGVAKENDGVVRRERLGVLAPGGGSNVKPSSSHGFEVSRNLKLCQDVKDAPNREF